MSVVSVVSCQVEFSVTCFSFVQRGPTKCGVTEYDHESSIVRVGLPHWRLSHRGKKFKILIQKARNNSDVTVH